MREPTVTDLVAFVSRLQPELTDDAIRTIFRLDPELLVVVNDFYRHERELGVQFLELHIALEEREALRA